MNDIPYPIGTISLDFSKNPTQAAFFKCTTPFQNYSGGFGSGKTSACCRKVQVLSSMANNMGVICRGTYPDLKDSTIPTFFETFLEGESWIKSWRASEHALTLKNNSLILFRHFETGHVKVGANLGWFFIDQAEEATEDIFLSLMGRLRRPVSARYGIMAMNPNGQDWQYRMFVRNQDPNFANFDSSSFDNQANLPPGYIEALLKTYPPEWIDRFVHGKWTQLSGLIYHEFDEKKHMVDPFVVPASWLKIRGNDWGVDAPATCVFIAQSPDGVYYVFDEYGGREKTPEEHAANILQTSSEYGIFRASVLDQSAWHRAQDLKSVADKYAQSGYHCVPATKDLMASILHVKHLLKEGKLLFFRGKTNATIEEIKKWKWGARTQGKEVPAKGNDHYLDALRYALFWVWRKRSPGDDSRPAQAQRGPLLSLETPVSCDMVTGLPN